MEKDKQETKAKLALEDIYELLCPNCQDKLVSTVADLIATDAIKEQLKKQWKGEST